MYVKMMCTVSDNIRFFFFKRIYECTSCACCRWMLCLPNKSYFSNLKMWMWNREYEIVRGQTGQFGLRWVTFAHRNRILRWVKVFVYSYIRIFRWVKVFVYSYFTMGDSVRIFVYYDGWKCWYIRILRWVKVFDIHTLRWVKVFVYSYINYDITIVYHDGRKCLVWPQMCHFRPP